jgi:hypothetical protein
MSNTPKRKEKKARPRRVSPYAVRITVIMVFIIALMHLPHLFYAVIHIFIFVICALSLGKENWRRRPIWTAAVVLVGIIYNPIIPIHLNRALWILINIPTAMLFFHVLDDEIDVSIPVDPSAFITAEPSSSFITEPKAMKSQAMKNQEPPAK